MQPCIHTYMYKVACFIFPESICSNWFPSYITAAIASSTHRVHDAASDCNDLPSILIAVEIGCWYFMSPARSFNPRPCLLNGFCVICNVWLNNKKGLKCMVIMVFYVGVCSKATLLLEIRDVGSSGRISSAEGIVAFPHSPAIFQLKPSACSLIAPMKKIASS